MEIILDRSIANKFDIQFISNSTPLVGQKNWSPLIDVFLALSSQLDAAFSRHRISGETVARAVPNFVGVVDSLKTLQRENFKKFADAVHIRK